MDIIVVGGGAAGFFGAIACAEAHPAFRVKILEKSTSVLGKVRISGGGRCNVTHACYDPELLVLNYPRGGQALLGPFHQFQSRDTIAWFKSRGVALKAEADGRVFPATDKSQTIIDCLTGSARAAGVSVETGVQIQSILRRELGGFVIVLDSGKQIFCDRLLLATGSGLQGLKWAQELGHSVESPVPSLFTLIISDVRLQGLSGVAVQNAEVRLVGSAVRQKGPMLITHWGLSGPVILKLSAWGARFFFQRDYRVKIKINWTGLSKEDIQGQFRQWRIQHPRKLISVSAPLDLPQRLWKRLVLTAGLAADQRWANLSRAQTVKLIDELWSGSYEVVGKSTGKEEFVTCGGISLKEINFKTMESRICPGLYFAGEILDIDGLTGGFNFQCAWTTAWLAGRAGEILF